MIKPATVSLERTILVILYKMFWISSLIQFRKNNERLNMVRNVAETKAKQNKTTENFSMATPRWQHNPEKCNIPKFYIG